MTFPLVLQYIISSFCLSRGRRRLSLLVNVLVRDALRFPINLSWRKDKERYSIWREVIILKGTETDWHTENIGDDVCYTKKRMATKQEGRKQHEKYMQDDVTFQRKRLIGLLLLSSIAVLVTLCLFVLFLLIEWYFSLEREDETQRKWLPESRNNSLPCWLEILFFDVTSRRWHLILEKGNRGKESGKRIGRESGEKNKQCLCILYLYSIVCYLWTRNWPVELLVLWHLVLIRFYFMSTVFVFFLWQQITCSAVSV